MLPAPEHAKYTSSGCFGGTQWQSCPSESLQTSKVSVFVISW